MAVPPTKTLIRDNENWVRRFYISTAHLRRSPGACIAVGSVAAIIALLVRVGIGDSLIGFPFLTFFSAVAISAFVWGWRAGLSSAILGGALAWYYLVEPLQSFSLLSSTGILAVAFYIWTTGVIVLLTGGMHRAFDDYEVTDAARRKLNEDLERLVAQRTAELSTTNEKLVLEGQSRKQAEHQVRQLQKMEAVGQLTGGIAHDFNNMLAVVLGSLDMAKRYLARDVGRVQKYIDNAIEGARLAAELTARLLAFSRQQPLDPRVIDANKIVGETSEMMRRTLGESIRVETVLAGGLWQTFVDPSQVNNVLLNLCVNARDAMPEGGRLTIETSNAALDDAYAAASADVMAGQYVLIGVTDTGIGMAADAMERCFDPFFTTKPAGRGTGLGLSQVYGFVKQSGGHVKVYSEVGQGTSVKIYLPRHVGAGQPEAAASDSLPADLALASSDEVVLVVEDDQRVRRVSVDALHELGYAVLEADGAIKALAILANGTRVDLLFTDIVMPDIDGRKLADRARASRPDLKVLYTTGYTRNAIVHNGMLDPGVTFLPKPFTIAQLAAKVRQAIDGK